MPIEKVQKTVWDSPIMERRWRGYRQISRGIEAFSSLESFEQAEKSELEESLDDYERETLGRLLARGNKAELEVFIRTHGANPLFPPEIEIDLEVGVAWADVLDLKEPPALEAVKAILNGEIVHLLFQAGEATRFQEGPFYTLNPVTVAKNLKDELNLNGYLERIAKAGEAPSAPVSKFILETPLGPKQPLLIRAALRRLITEEIGAGRLSPREAKSAYELALKNQKLLFFVCSHSEVDKFHWENLKKFKFFGFDPSNVVTIEQELVRGLNCDDRGRVSLLAEEWGKDAAGHLYALVQAARKGDFISYSASGEPIRHPDIDAFEYLAGQGGRILSVIRINDMDRHTTEIVNAKAVSFALRMFDKGFVNVIEGVSNPLGQKGGTGTTFGDPEIHVLTETHENSFPALSRAFEKGMKKYLEAHQGHHPAYNAMRQLSDLVATRRALEDYRGRIVFVPRQKEVNGELVSYLGVDMPMGDLSLLYRQYKSRMFQFTGPNGRGLLIHDVKFKENLPFALNTIEKQLTDEHILSAAEELHTGKILPFKKPAPGDTYYHAPAPEFE